MRVRIPALALILGICRKMPQQKINNVFSSRRIDPGLQGYKISTTGISKSYFCLLMPRCRLFLYLEILNTAYTKCFGVSLLHIESNEPTMKTNEIEVLSILNNREFFNQLELVLLVFEQMVQWRTQEKNSAVRGYGRPRRGSAGLRPRTAENFRKNS